VLAGGAMSYTVYLYHYPVVLGVGRALQHVLGSASLAVLALQALAITVTTLVVSTFLFKYCELPFMDKHWPSRLFAKYAIRRTGIRACDE
jgi:peptidoglycan/LPS O-acetylase OafA/YrhL